MYCDESYMISNRTLYKVSITGVKNIIKNFFLTMLCPTQNLKWIWRLWKHDRGIYREALTYLKRKRHRKLPGRNILLSNRYFPDHKIYTFQCWFHFCSTLDYTDYIHLSELKIAVWFTRSSIFWNFTDSLIAYRFEFTIKNRMTYSYPLSRTLLCNNDTSWTQLENIHWIHMNSRFHFLPLFQQDNWHIYFHQFDLLHVVLWKHGSKFVT